MVIKLRNIKKTPQGYLPDEEVIGTVSLINGKTVVDINNGELKERVEKMFSTPLIAPKAMPSKPGVHGHTLEKFEPNTPEYFTQIVYQLDRLGLDGILESSEN